VRARVLAYLLSIRSRKRAVLGVHRKHARADAFFSPPLVTIAERATERKERSRWTESFRPQLPRSSFEKRTGNARIFPSFSLSSSRIHVGDKSRSRVEQRPRLHKRAFKMLGVGRDVIKHQPLSNITSLRIIEILRYTFLSAILSPPGTS